MALFTFNTWPVLKGMKNENETFNRQGVGGWFSGRNKR